jgi:hypothetical protein
MRKAFDFALPNQMCLLPHVINVNITVLQNNLFFFFPSDNINVKCEDKKCRSDNSNNNA